MTWLRRSVFILACWLGAVIGARGCKAQEAPEPMVITRHALGWTSCDADGVVRSWIRADLPVEQFVAVSDHERVHREQAARHPSCAHYEAWWRNRPERLMRLEAEAYCRGWPATPRKREQVQLHVYLLFKHHVAIGDVVQAVAEFCGD